MWTEACVKEMCNHVMVDLKEDLKEIDCHPRVDVSVGSMIRSARKLINLDSNYLEGDGDSCRSHVQ